MSIKWDGPIGGGKEVDKDFDALNFSDRLTRKLMVMVEDFDLNLVIGSWLDGLVLDQLVSDDILTEVQKNEILRHKEDQFQKGRFNLQGTEAKWLYIDDQVWEGIDRVGGKLKAYDKIRETIEEYRLDY